MDDLKPCPFCGGRAAQGATSAVSGFVFCTECNMATGKFWDEPMTDAAGQRKKWYEVAAEMWNRRANNGVS